MRRRLPVLAGIFLLSIGVGVAAARVGAAKPTVVAYPSAQTIPRSGKLPGGSVHSISLNEPVGGDDSALIVVANAKRVGLAADVRKLGPIGLQLRFRHFVRFGVAVVPDTVMPWDGSPQPTEQQNQPVSIEVSVPYGTRPGTYTSTVTVTADSTAVRLPLTITVYNFALSKPGDANGNLLTVFGVGPQAYVGKTIDLFHYTAPDQIRAANDSLFKFLSDYRISPDSWGYGIPNSPSGYGSSGAWWKDSAGNMARELAAGQFPDLWIPLSNNRAKSEFAGGVDPLAPESWCSYLGAVKQFWQLHQFTAAGQIPYAYPYDEPGDAHTSLLARQATALHRCFPGARMLVTGTPSAATSRLFDGKGSDDVDIWAAVDWRYYGKFTNPGRLGLGRREHDYLSEIDKARSHHKLIFAYTYYGVPGFPSFSVDEPLSNPRMFVLWTALEGIDGILYGQGTTTYGGAGNPLAGDIGNRGESVLIYPGNGRPIASARLEEIRDGIEDWDIFAAVRRRFGAAKVRSILGAHGLFSADAKGVKLACTTGCDLKARPPQAWPLWSHDWSTAGRIEAARRDALRLVSAPSKG